LQGKTGGEMNVDSVKKALIFAAAAVFLIFFCGLSSAGAFDQEPVDRTLFLAQATQESTNETGEPLGLHVGQHLAQHTEISADTLSKAPDDVFTDQANEPVELPSLRFSLLMAEQTQESGEEQAKEDQEDEDEYDDDYEDEYGDEDVQLISDPLIQGNTDCCGRPFETHFTISAFRCVLSTACCRVKDGRRPMNSANFFSTPRWDF
jgi:hypothetical protein